METKESTDDAGTYIHPTTNGRPELLHGYTHVLSFAHTHTHAHTHVSKDTWYSYMYSPRSTIPCSHTISYRCSYTKWQRLIILWKVHPPIIVSRRHRRCHLHLRASASNCCFTIAISVLLRILRFYVIITTHKPRVSYLTDTLHAHLYLDNENGISNLH